MSSKDINDPNSYKYPFRENFEIRLLFVWLLGGVLTAITPFFLDVPSRIYHIMGFCMVVFSFFIGREGIELWLRKDRLKGYALDFVDPSSDHMLDKFQITDKKVRKAVKRNRR